MSREQLEFKTEVNRLLDLVIHSLYSHKEIFLRELISNASDALDKARFLSLTQPEVLEDGADWKIRLDVDNEKKTLTISDNGIGMSREEIIQELGTIAHSGTLEFLEKLKESGKPVDQSFIGQFGVGFYSAFMVADRVVVISRKAGSGGTTGVKWESEARGAFTVEEVEKATKGTDVILYLKEEENQFLKEWELRRIVRKYSDYVEHPIVMEVEREKESSIDKTQKVKMREEETLNSRKALWLKDKAEISTEEYNEFYKHVAKDFSDPLRVIHFRAEGTSEFAALLFLPARPPFDFFQDDAKIGPMLYVKRVQIMDHCEDLVPKYLRFVRGVVESSDLPLNVSRELLQNNRQVEIIRKNITKKVLDTLADLKKAEPEVYRKFHKEFGRILKEGIHFDMERRETVADLLLLPSTRVTGEELTTLPEYVERMKPDQTDIYYLTGGPREELERSPYLESFRDKDTEVLLLTDDVDELIFERFEYKGKAFKSVLKGEISLDKEESEARNKAGETMKSLMDTMKEQLQEWVKEVRPSGRLKDSPCCLVSDEHAMGPAMERMMKAMGHQGPAEKRILEINPNHPLLEAMNTLQSRDQLARCIDVLFDQALILQGGKPRDAAKYTRDVAEMMLAGLH